MAIEIISTLKPKNNGTFPIAEAKDIDVNGVRLDKKLEEIANNSGGSVDSCEIYVAYYPDATNTLTIKTASEFWLEKHGAKPTIITQIVDTLPTVLKEADEENLILYAYILKSTGVGYLDEGGTTITLGQLAFSLDGFDKGWTTDINSVSDLGVYCVRTQGNSNAGGCIIDVTELPTEGIDESALYRVPVGTLVFANSGYYKQTATVYVVENTDNLATGEAFSADGKTVKAVYYDNSKGVAYGYVDATVSAMFAQLGATVPVGWHAFGDLLGMVGKAYGGVVTSFADMSATSTLYLCFTHKLYHYKNGWVAIDDESVIELTASTLTDGASGTITDKDCEKVMMCFHNSTIHFRCDAGDFYFSPTQTDREVDFKYITMTYSELGWVMAMVTVSMGDKSYTISIKGLN